MKSIASVSCLLFAYIYVSSSFGHMTLAKWWCNYYIKTTSWRHFGRIIKLRLLEFRGMCTRLHKSASITLVMIMKKTANIFTLVTLRPEYSAWTWSIPRLLMTQLLTSPVRRHAIIWTNAAIFSIRPQGAYFTEILFKTQNVSHWRKCTWKYRLRNGHHFCFGINVLTFTSRIFFSSAVSLIVTWIVCCWRLFGQTADNPGWNIFRKFRKSFFCFFSFFPFFLRFSSYFRSLFVSIRSPSPFPPFSPPPFFLSSLLFPYCWVSLH